MNPAAVDLDWPDARMDSVGSSDVRQSDMNGTLKHCTVHAAPRQRFQEGAAGGSSTCNLCRRSARNVAGVAAAGGKEGG